MQRRIENLVAEERARGVGYVPWYPSLGPGRGDCLDRQRRQVRVRTIRNDLSLCWLLAVIVRHRVIKHINADALDPQLASPTCQAKRNDDGGSEAFYRVRELLRGPTVRHGEHYPDHRRTFNPLTVELLR